MWDRRFRLSMPGRERCDQALSFQPWTRSRNSFCWQRFLNENRLEAILIGNMAAALHGAPVSTIDIDLFFRKTPANMQKLKRVAEALEAVILRPYYPVLARFELPSGIAMDCRSISWVRSTA